MVGPGSLETAGAAGGGPQAARGTGIPSTFVKQASASAPISAEPRGPDHREAEASRWTRPRASRPRNTDPLAHESVERRQPHDRHRARPRTPRAVHGSSRASPPSWSITRRARRPQHRPGAEEQEALEQRVIERVQQRSREAPAAPRAGCAVRHPQHSHAHAQQDDPDILDAVIRQESLEVVLGQGPEHPQSRRSRSPSPNRVHPNQAGAPPRRSSTRSRP